jgi:hypothetical protein
MKYAEERGGMATSVHDWKPCPPDRFAKLMHQYTTQYGDEWGHGALTMTAMKLDRISTCTIFYYPQNGILERKTRSPVLMTVSMIDGKVITFESLKYGVNAPEDGFRDEHGNKVNADGVKIIETGINFKTSGPKPTSLPVPRTMVVTINADGTMDIKLSWGKYCHGSVSAESLALFFRKDSQQPSSKDSYVMVPADTTYYTFMGLDPSETFSFGVSAVSNGGHTEIQTCDQWIGINRSQASSMTANAVAVKDGNAIISGKLMTGTLSAVASKGEPQTPPQGDVLTVDEKKKLNDELIGMREITADLTAKAIALNVPADGIKIAMMNLSAYVSSLTAVWADTPYDKSVLKAKLDEFAKHKAQLSMVISYLSDK